MDGEQQGSARDQIRSFILRNFLFTDDASAVSDDTKLIEDGIIDSTGILELMLFLDEELSIKVADDEVTPANFGSIEAIASFVARKQTT